MEFSIATLLSHLSEDKLIAGKNLEKKLGCEDEVSLQTLRIVLDVLERIGILEKERGKYRRIRQENLVEAKLRCSSKGFCFAIQDDEDAEDGHGAELHEGAEVIARGEEHPDRQDAGGQTIPHDRPSQGGRRPGKPAGRD